MLHALATQMLRLHRNNVRVSDRAVGCRRVVLATLALVRRCCDGAGRGTDTRLRPRGTHGDMAAARHTLRGGAGASVLLVF